VDPVGLHTPIRKSKKKFSVIECGDVEWIELVQYGDKRKALVNMVMVIRVP
jgi:hypothetical protein